MKAVLPLGSWLELRRMRIMHNHKKSVIPTVVVSIHIRVSIQCFAHDLWMRTWGVSDIIRRSIRGQGWPVGGFWAPGALQSTTGQALSSGPHRWLSPLDQSLLAQCHLHQAQEEVSPPPVPQEGPHLLAEPTCCHQHPSQSVQNELQEDEGSRWVSITGSKAVLKCCGKFGEGLHYHYSD